MDITLDENTLLINGEKADKTQIDDYEELKDIVPMHSNYYEESQYSSWNYEGKKYNVTTIVNSIADKKETGNFAFAVTILSFNPECDGIMYCAFYYDVSVIEDVYTMSNVICEIRGNADIAGIYTVPQSLLDL